MEIIIAVVVIACFLIKEKIQRHQANKYADQVVKRYSDKKKP